MHGRSETSARFRCCTNRTPMSFMNIRRLIFLTCFAVVAFSAPVVLAGSRAHSMAMRSPTTSSSSRFTPVTRQSTPTFQHRNDTRSFSRGTAGLRHSNDDSLRRRRTRVIVVSSFGFPYYSFFPSFYFSSFYPYGYPYGYSPYGGGYGGLTYYDDGGGYYRNDAGYYGNPGYRGYARTNASIVTQVQRTLAREGYYKGGIDGIEGPRTHYAIRAYQRAHNLRVDGTINEELLADMGLR